MVGATVFRCLQTIWEEEDVLWLAARIGRERKVWLYAPPRRAMWWYSVVVVVVVVTATAVAAAAAGTATTGAAVVAAVAVIVYIERFVG